MNEDVATNDGGAAADNSQQPTGQDNSQGASAQSQGGAKPAAQGDRGDSVPSYRLREVTEKARQFEAELTRLRAQSESDQKRIRALAGVDTPSREDQELSQAKAVLEKMYPALGKLNEETVQKLMGLTEVVPSLQANTEQYWSTRGAATFRELSSMASKELGGELSETGQRRLQAAFIDWVKTDQEAANRYLQSDPDLVKDFWTDYSNTFIAPVRRTTGAQLINRGQAVRQPRGGGAAPNAPAVKKPDFTNEDDVHDGAWDALVQRLNAR